MKLLSRMITLALVLASSNAMAGVQVNASISNTQYRVVDLTPHDGEEAMVQFNGRGVEKNASGGYYGGQYNPTNFYRNANEGGFNALNLAVQHESVNVDLHYAANSFGDMQGHAQADQFGMFFGNQEFYMTFLIYPHTAMAFSGTFQASLDNFGSSEFPSTTNFRAYASTGVFNGGEQQRQSYSLTMEPFAQPGSLQQNFNVTMSNNSDNYQVGYFRTAYQFDSEMTPPVPEPETYAMLSLGLFGLALMRRRRIG